MFADGRFLGRIIWIIAAIILSYALLMWFIALCYCTYCRHLPTTNPYAELVGLFTCMCCQAGSATVVGLKKVGSKSGEGMKSGLSRMSSGIGSVRKKISDTTGKAATATVGERNLTRMRSSRLAAGVSKVGSGVYSGAGVVSRAASRSLEGMTAIASTDTAGINRFVASCPVKCATMGAGVAA